MTSRRLIAGGAGLMLALMAMLALWGLESRRLGSQPALDRGKLRYPHPELGVTIDNYPKVDGSTSTQPLQMILACKVFGVETLWSHSELDDTRTLSPNWYTVYAPLPGASPEDPVQTPLLYKYLESLVQPHGTSEAYANLIKKRADLILVARAPSDDESKQAKKHGVHLDARPVALDAFVFLLHGRNPVASLTIDQLRDIYSGRIVNWRDLGGPDAKIRPYQRPRNSGSQELMKRFVMRGRPMIEGPDLLLETLMSSTFLALDKDVHGISAIRCTIITNSWRRPTMSRHARSTASRRGPRPSDRAATRSCPRSTPWCVPTCRPNSRPAACATGCWDRRDRRRWRRAAM